MGKGGRFGKYGEQKRFERLRQKKQVPSLPKNMNTFPAQKLSKSRPKHLKTTAPLPFTHG